MRGGLFAAFVAAMKWGVVDGILEIAHDDGGDVFEGGSDFGDLLGEGVTKVAGGGVVFEVGARLVGINADEEEMLYGLGIWVVEFDEEGLGSSLLYRRWAEYDATAEGVTAEIDEGVFCNVEVVACV